MATRGERTFRFAASAAAAMAGPLLLILLGGCPGTPPLVSGESDLTTGLPVFRNTTDPTNGGATYVGSAACAACHPAVMEMTRAHAHGQALKRVQGVPAEYPIEGDRAGVPQPPGGRPWTDISFLIGGYTHAANFVDAGGFVVTTGASGVAAQWDLAFPPAGRLAGFVPYRPDLAAPLPLTYECFRCHVTGPQPQTPDDSRSQESRPGILGTWAEAGVRCEACHGPGSFHVPNPQARNIFVDPTPATCGRCHSVGDASVIAGTGTGYVNPFTQYAELRASGGHANFNCTFCHSPHASTFYDGALGRRNDCRACHADMNLAFHEGKVFERGAYVEPLDCVSCHMPFTGAIGQPPGPEIVGTEGGRMGDVRSHIFRIDTQRATYLEMFTPDLLQVVKDAAGRAAVTPDFVCARCHNGVGNAFTISPRGATVLATGMHTKSAAGE